MICINFAITSILIFQFRKQPNQNNNVNILNYDTLIIIIIVFLISNGVLIYYAIQYYVENFLNYDNTMSNGGENFDFDQLLLSIDAEAEQQQNQQNSTETIQHSTETETQSSIIKQIYQIFRTSNNNNSIQQQNNDDLLIV